jgi:AraC-like DNA-binding protein
MGFQYKGFLSNISGPLETRLASAGITGITDSFRHFKNSPSIGTVLVYFTETGFSYFSSLPVHELFNHSVPLDTLFDADLVAETEEKLYQASGDRQCIAIIERFLLTQLKHREADRLIVEAVKLIYNSKGNLRVTELNATLNISASPFEKRFRKLVGVSPKKFSSIVRFNTLIENFPVAKSLAEICYDNNFFDQAHFSKEFKRFTGTSPGQFKRLH